MWHRSKDWYQQHQNSTAEPEARAAQRPSSSTSQHAQSHTGPQTAVLQSSLMPWNNDGATLQGRAASMRPHRIGSGNYAQSEVGHYSTNVSQSIFPRNAAQSLQSSHFSFSCPDSECSQLFMTFDQLKEHVQIEHGSQNVLTSNYRGTATWHRSLNNQGHQSAVMSGRTMAGQRFKGEASRVQSLRQRQMRAPNMGYATRTEPGSIPAQPYHLDDDFENIAVHSQDTLLTSGNNENLLIQIGMIGDLLPSASDTNDLGPDTSQGQGPTRPKDQQKRQAPPFSTDEVTTFLKTYASNISNERIVSAIQMTVESLQSTSSSGDINSTASPALSDIHFPRVTEDGKSVYRCPWHECKFSKPRRCELKKHYQRHTLPWACTFDGCVKPFRLFGSKNDWKRHETKQHAQQEKWRCGEQESNTSGRSVPATGDDACMRLFCTKDLYLQHLRDQHCISDGSLTGKLCELQRIGAQSQGRYWCGFCNRIILMELRGLDGDAERFNHIDRHFTKDRLHIRQWKPLNGRPLPADNALLPEQPSTAEGSDAGSDDAETDEDTAAQLPATYTTPPPLGNKKRPASTTTAGSEQGRAPKAARTSRSRADARSVRLLRCCHCRNMFQAWQEGCTGCNHQTCHHCQSDRVKR